ncbi:Calcineurin B-like protein 7 [Olea europaea subsp. europaea]|uniref:Calcineurin B-like protein n=1 Tax=Olea europaea subsp. europaea TaxID=158383 RepID=A0A8S0SVE0_OLEEU|nr:Calcineurin B-like protein 7 [Olea europaea subsp. europaea]
MLRIFSINANHDFLYGNIINRFLQYKNFLAVAFRLYDLNHTGYIERDELKEMVSATLSESDLYLSDDAVEAIVEKTLWEVDLNGDGKIDLEEWKEMVARNPSLVKNMTLPYLREITLAFPHFVMTTEVPDSKLVFQTAN